MTKFSDNDEERVAKLLRVLPPAPQAWVQAAQELPRARRELDEIVALAQTDQSFRDAVIADLETALQERGFDVEPDLLPVLRQRLSAS
jgi:hypothetical protein